jgi:hypothetical protein
MTVGKTTPKIDRIARNIMTTAKCKCDTFYRETLNL